MAERINLGDKVQDPITGLVGIVMARTEWMFGCVRCTVQPQDLKDGKPIETSVFDEPQLKVLQRSAVPDMPQWREPVQPERARGVAGPRADVAQRQNPKAR